jgi:methylated-DNA-protein-cysteine methyltransferase-like protein
VRFATNPLYARIYVVVRRVPRGRVATYGQVASLARLPGRARLVGYALRALQDDTVPWHRVVNAAGRLSPRAQSQYVELQRRLLEAEGVRFDAGGAIPLDRFRWRPQR